MAAKNLQNTKEYKNLESQIKQTTSTLKALESQYSAVAADADKAAASAKKLGASLEETQKPATGLMGYIRNLAGAFLGIQTGQWLVNTSDQLTQINARLQLMTGSAEAAAEANDQIYQAAMRARGAYTDMADLVSQLGTLAPEAFSDPTGNLNTGELIAFAEQLQKQMALSGTSTMAAQAAMLQLTQGLASGVLRGEELNSVLEQTPMVAQTIADYMGVDIGTMRELASEGAITADVVKNALLGAAAETNAAFEQMPLTWGQAFAMAQNIAIQVLQPLFDFISDVPQTIADNFDMLLPVFAGLAAMAGVLAAQALVMAASFALANLPIILMVAAVAAFTYGMVQAGATASDVFEVIGQGFGWLYAFVGNIVVNLYNLFASFAEFFANFMDNPIQSVLNLFFDFADTVLGVLETIAGAIDFIFGNNMNLQGTVAGWRNDLKNWVTDTVGDNEVQIKRMEAINFQESMDQFGAYGRGVGDMLSNLNFNSLGSGFDLSQYTGDAAAYNQLSGISDQLGGIGSSVKGIEKSVNMSDEDIKALVDVAERRYVNQVNLTSQTPVITVNGANTGRTAQDRRALADAIEQILREEWASGSVRSTAYA